MCFRFACRLCANDSKTFRCWLITSRAVWRGAWAKRLRGSRGGRYPRCSNTHGPGMSVNYRTSLNARLFWLTTKSCGLIPAGWCRRATAVRLSPRMDQVDRIAELKSKPSCARLVARFTDLTALLLASTSREPLLIRKYSPWASRNINLNETGVSVILRGLVKSRTTILNFAQRMGSLRWNTCCTCTRRSEDKEMTPRNNHTLVAALLSLFLIVIFSGITSAQPAPLATGTLRGAVATLAPDGQSYSVPGASLKLKASTQSLDAVSDEEGNYQFTNLSPGDYTLEATVQGFKTTSKAITIRAGETAVENIKLEVADVTATVTVTSSNSGQGVQTSETAPAPTIKQADLQ